MLSLVTSSSTSTITIIIINIIIFTIIINHHWWRSRRCYSPRPWTLYKTRARQSCLEAFGEGRAGDGHHYVGHCHDDCHDYQDYDASLKLVGQPSQVIDDLFVLVQQYMLHARRGKTNIKHNLEHSTPTTILLLLVQVLLDELVMSKQRNANIFFGAF